MRKPVTGYCPETDRKQTITVQVEQINLGGGLGSGQKVLGYNCPYAHEHGCVHRGTDGRKCPLFQIARN